MRRREIIKMCSLLGISLPFQSVIASCVGNCDTKSSSFSGSVLIVGAGAAGMASGYLLAQRGVDFEILEASSIYGGRMKRTTSFADFPIPLGAEWLHVSEHELTNIVNKTPAKITTQLQGYAGKEKIGYFENDVLSYSSLSTAFGSRFPDKKFINSTWFDFFEEYLTPSIQSNMRLNTQIVSIDYQGNNVVVTDSNGVIYEADKVIVTVPLKILQNEVVNFKPALSHSKLNAIKGAPIWGGIKVFLEFTEKFYPTYLAFSDSETQTGQRAYFDASYAQNTSKNILGLFAVGLQAKQYQKKSVNDQLDFILNELDNIFDNRASKTYVKHIVQNWDDEPFIQSAYLADVASSSISSTLSDSVDGKLYFAGDSYTQEDDWGGVHNAARSARFAIDEILLTKMTP